MRSAPGPHVANMGESRRHGPSVCERPVGGLKPGRFSEFTPVCSQPLNLFDGVRLIISDQTILDEIQPWQQALQQLWSHVLTLRVHDEAVTQRMINSEEHRATRSERVLLQ